MYVYLRAALTILIVHNKIKIDVRAATTLAAGILATCSSPILSIKLIISFLFYLQYSLLFSIEIYSEALWAYVYMYVCIAVVERELYYASILKLDILKVGISDFSMFILKNNSLAISDYIFLLFLCYFLQSKLNGKLNKIDFPFFILSFFLPSDWILVHKQQKLYW